MNKVAVVFDDRLQEQIPEVSKCWRPSGISLSKSLLSHFNLGIILRVRKQKTLKANSSKDNESSSRG